MASAFVPMRTFGQDLMRAPAWGAARWQRVLSAAIASFILWPQSSVDAGIGLDQSWEAGLALARMHHLAWGPQIVYTYGPLGFLQSTAYYSFDQSLLASIYQPLVLAALFLGITAALRQRHAPMTSLLGAFFTTGVTAVLYIEFWLNPGLKYPELLVLAAFVWAAVPMLQHGPTRSTVFTTCCALGAVAGLQLLVKVNTGIAIVAIALAASLLLGWKEIGRHCATLAAFAMSTLVWWVLAGQRPQDLPTWLRYGAAIVSGYSDGMALPLSAFTIIAVVMSLAWIAALWVMYARARAEISRSFVVLVTLVTLITDRSAVGRPAHLFLLLGLIVVGIAITPLSKIARRVFVVLAVAVVVVALGAERAVLSATGDHTHDRIVAAVQAPGQAVDRLLTLATPGKFGKRIDQAKARQRALYAVPERFVKTIGSETVHIDPDEASAAWAYGMAWRPAPIFQAHQAYMPSLDDLNSQTMAAGPRFVLSWRSPTSPATGTIDGRLGVQQSPRYSRALLCDYTVKDIENRWALFAHTGSRCAPPAPLSQVSIRGKEAVTIPAPSGPDMAVLVGIDLAPTVIDRLFQGTVAPLTVPTVVLDGAAYRLIAANAAEPFLVNVPASVDNTNLQIHAHTLGIGRAPALGQADVVARLRFYEMRVQP
ncbi:MAG: hypothetical protein VX424_14890 [Actinomycetota bacterium]|nr:hypothetical protein [Actinomycetota bacterium]